eukprot:gnl/TRDRNA2_/TRDRNA2_130689_c0_seq1.p1 gnl/TRDRNA2_/TRDRNA2_130689_c0~~gnl/TRDRNA2_/TRDRNA2_130689_c0_seq1.p1  ORF type:complete len:127 (+),score=26.06 gnl/TRDRNA2_/TRDRNA2_130689_c0_seq1:58-438(+)
MGVDKMGSAYKKIRRVGQGTFGVAYLVESLREPVGERYILKRMPLAGAKKGSEEVAFREAQLLMRISRGCPFIVGFREVFVDKKGSQLSLVMEWASGGDLRHILDKRGERRFTEAESLDLIAHDSV